VKGHAWWGLLATLLLISIIAHRGMLSILVLILILATAVSELWTRYCLNQVIYRRHLGHSQIAFGEETTLTLEFVNVKPLPLAWLLVRDEFPNQVHLLTGELRHKASLDREWFVSLVSLRWYERLTRTHRIRGEQRGQFNLGPAELVSGDVFGFRRRSQNDPAVDVLTVYPKVVPVEALGLPAGRPMGEWFAPRRIQTDPLRFSMVREYVPGDNPRHIHWKASAHTGTLQTKVFEPSQTLTLMLALDVQTLPRRYEYISEYLEYGCSAAASLATHALAERYMVGLFANAIAQGRRDWVHVRAGRSPQQLPHLLTALAALGPVFGDPFARMLGAMAPLLPFGATVIAITAMPEEPVYEALAALQESGHRVLLCTIGDEPVAVPESLTAYHLGGRDAWHRLETLELA
jgi:uncharacterized protein (DUF58 family)